MSFSTTTTTLLFLLIAAISATAAEDECNPEDKKALLQIKKSFNDSVYFQRWSPTTDCCTWDDSVVCDPTSHRVTSLTIFNFPPLSGPIPSAITDLPHLTSLDLRKLPNLTGPIPLSLSKLTNLTFLRLDWNSLTGPVPDLFNRLKQLTYINLSYNKLSGSIPPSLGQSPVLDFLRLDRNLLTGSIPDSFGSINGGSMFRLDLSLNRLSGPIPTSIGKMNFSMLQLARNNLSGDASFLFGKSKPLEQLDLSRNSFSFDMSKTGEEIPSGIEWLLLDHNNIFGSLPASMADLHSLNNLNVSYNRLCGNIPTGGNFGRDFDEYSFVHNKCLCGSPLPACN